MSLSFGAFLRITISCWIYTWIVKGLPRNDPTPITIRTTIGDVVVTMYWMTRFIGPHVTLEETDKSVKQSHYLHPSSNIAKSQTYDLRDLIVLPPVLYDHLV